MRVSVGDLAKDILSCRVPATRCYDIKPKNRKSSCLQNNIQILYEFARNTSKIQRSTPGDPRVSHNCQLRVLATLKHIFSFIVIHRIGFLTPYRWYICRHNRLRIWLGQIEQLAYRAQFKNENDQVHLRPYLHWLAALVVKNEFALLTTVPKTITHCTVSMLYVLNVTSLRFLTWPSTGNRCF